MKNQEKLALFLLDPGVLEDIIFRGWIVGEFHNHVDYLYEEEKMMRIEEEDLQELHDMQDNTEAFIDYIRFEGEYKGDYTELIHNCGDEATNEIVDIMKEMWEKFLEKINIINDEYFFLWLCNEAENTIGDNCTLNELAEFVFGGMEEAIEKYKEEE